MLAGSYARTNFRKQKEITPEHNVAFITEMLERFKYFAKHNGDRMAARQETLQKKLKAAEAKATDANTKEALEKSLVNSGASEESAQAMYKDMNKFFTSMEVVLGSTKTGGTGRGCADITCGEHASCTSTTAGAECVCDEGYQGDGQKCDAPSAFIPRQLLYDGALGRSPQVRDTAVYVVGRRVVVAWRDISHGNAGYVKLGDLLNNQVSFAPAERFAPKAFSPSIVAWETGKIIVAYRDDDKAGYGILIAAAIGISGVRGADKHLTWGKPMTFAHNQSHRTSMLAISNNRFILNYSDHSQATKTSVSATSFGSSTLGMIKADADVSLIGTFRFAEEAVTRIESILINEKSFIVAFRGAKLIDEMDSTKFIHQEASCVLGSIHGEDLVFDPHPLHLEPMKQQFWARSLSLVEPNVFSYAYHSGLDQKTKLVTVKVDPSTHKMTPVSTMILREGDTPYLRMVSMPYTGAPHTVTFYQPEGATLLVNICSVSAEAVLSQCEDTEIAPAVDSFGAASLPSGRMLLLFAPGGVPYYQIVGLARK